MEDPTRHLIDPGDPTPLPNRDFADPFLYFGIISPSGWINEIVAEVTGQDFFGYVSETLSGEWTAFAKCGMTFAHLGDFFQDLGIAIQQATLTVDRSWAGNAADAAYKYFSELAAATSAMQLALREASDKYDKAAKGAWLLANQLSNIISAICDAVILASVASTAGTILAETGVGAVLGYGVAALQVVKIIELVGKAGILIQTAGTLIYGLLGMVMDLANQGGSLKRFPLPGESYDHPAVSG